MLRFLSLAYPVHVLGLVAGGPGKALKVAAF